MRALRWVSSRRTLVCMGDGRSLTVTKTFSALTIVRHTSRSSRPKPRRCSRSIPDNGKAICCACRGVPMTARTSSCGREKTGAYISIPVTDELKAALDAAPKKSPLMLTNSDGKP
jgi:hypothetical protein